jgi:hypothetical protein
MFVSYSLEPITNEFLDAIDDCNDAVELAKLALRIIAETEADDFTASLDPEKIAAAPGDVVELKKLIGALLAHREMKRFSKFEF